MLGIPRAEPAHLSRKPVYTSATHWSAFVRSRVVIPRHCVLNAGLRVRSPVNLGAATHDSFFVGLRTNPERQSPFARIHRNARARTLRLQAGFVTRNSKFVSTASELPTVQGQQDTVLRTSPFSPSASGLSVPARDNVKSVALGPIARPRRLARRDAQLRLSGSFASQLSFVDKPQTVFGASVHQQLARDPHGQDPRPVQLPQTADGDR